MPSSPVSVSYYNSKYSSTLSVLPLENLCSCDACMCHSPVSPRTLKGLPWLTALYFFIFFWTSKYGNIPGSVPLTLFIYLSLYFLCVMFRFYFHLHANISCLSVCLATYPPTHLFLTPAHPPWSWLIPVLPALPHGYLWRPSNIQKKAPYFHHPRVPPPFLLLHLP